MYYTSGLNNYDSYIANGEFCNDRTVNSTYWSGYTNTHTYGQENTLLASTTRVKDSCFNVLATQTVTLGCTNSNDIFTAKIGLITMDEYLLAGGIFPNDEELNIAIYLYTGQRYWTITPYLVGVYHEGETFLDFSVFMINDSGYFSNEQVGNRWFGNSFNRVRPVINLKTTTTFKAGTNGTWRSPYTVVGTNS